VGVLAMLVCAGLVWAGVAAAEFLRPDQATAGQRPSEELQPKKGRPAAPVCDPSRVVVDAAVDAQAYAPRRKPVLTLTVTNKGDAPCPVNVGTSQMEFLITSGSDRIFSSRDCQRGAQDLRKTLAPGVSEKANFTWKRNRSVPGCTDPGAIPGPGTYVLVTHLGERVSKKAVFTLE
jgi:hypothetical protein